MNKHIRDLYYGVLVLSLLVCIGVSSGETPSISDQNTRTVIGADFVADHQQGKAPHTVTFHDLSTGRPEQYAWDFGDGDVSSEANPVHTYATPGVYTVSLTVSGSAGFDKKTRIGYITVIEEPSVDTSSEPKSEESRLPNDSAILVQNGEMVRSEEVLFSEVNNSSLPSSVHADFSVIESDGIAPHTVHFSDHSSGPILSWLWNFGDGTTSAAQSPVHIFQNPGIYNITLTVRGDGTVDSVTKAGVVNVIAPVVSGFTAEPYEGTAPLKVQFHEQSTGIIIKREWSFGDGLFSELENPVHVYEVPGTYDVSLKVIGSHNEDIMTRPSYVIVHPDLPPPTPIQTPEPISELTAIPTPSPSLAPVVTPHAVPEPIMPNPLVDEPLPQSDTSPAISDRSSVTFTATPDTGPAPLTVHFTDTSIGSYDVRFWDFGDGSHSSDTHPTHLYEKPGDYTVCLTARLAGSMEELSASSVIHVSASPTTPVADFTISSTEGTAPFSIVCMDQSKGDITDWVWDFGDGKVIRGKNPTHTYILPGQYSITLMAKGPGGKDEIRKDSIIRVRSPQADLKAAFSAEPVHGNVPLQVSFHDESTGTITGWNWSFGDGQVSNEQNPQHLYSQAGNYTVTLSIIGPNGEISELGKDDFIIVDKVVQPVQAAFSALPISGDAPLTVMFTDKSTGNPDTWNWSFGDGLFSSEKEPSHTYTTPGIYDVTLGVSGQGGTDMVVKKGLISVLGSLVSPELIITANPDGGTAPLNVSFQRSCIENETGVLWSFGDGNTSIEDNPNHTYAEPGVYTVRLTIQDNAGHVRTVTKNAFVNVTKPVPAPLAQFSCNKTEGSVPCTIRCTDQSYGEVSEWKWDFGDGTYADTQDVIHTYNAPGTYVLSLWVKGTGGEDHTREGRTIHVKENIQESSQNNTKIDEIVPKTSYESLNLSSDDVQTSNRSTEVSGDIAIPEIIVSQTTGSAPLHLQFSSTWDHSPGTYLWDFGDGETSPEPVVNHTYVQPGTYSVHLTRQHDGMTQEIIQKNLINVTDQVAIPMASFSADPVSGPAPLSVNFRSESNGSISNWSWDFGDLSQGTGEVVTHTYTRPGTYSVALRVNGTAGSSIEVREDLITVGSPLTPPQARFRTDKKTGYAPLTVRFTDESLGRVTNWSWDFGDGTRSIERNPIHVFNETGVYSVSLTVSGPGGNNKISRKGYIVVSSEPEPLVAGFSLTPSEGMAPLSVQCMDNSTGIIKRYLWDFGDGAVSEEKNPTHRFTNPGSYIVTLTIYGPSGISSADQEVIVGPFVSKRVGSPSSPSYAHISKDDLTSPQSDQSMVSGASKPTADFAISTEKGTSPVTVTCEDRSTGTIESWSWDFGDGTYSIEQNPVHIYTQKGTFTISLTVKGPYGISSKKLRDAVTVS